MKRAPRRDDAFAEEARDAYSAQIRAERAELTTDAERAAFDRGLRAGYLAGSLVGFEAAGIKGRPGRPRLTVAAMQAPDAIEAYVLVRRRTARGMSLAKACTWLEEFGYQSARTYRRRYERAIERLQAIDAEEPERDSVMLLLDSLIALEALQRSGVALRGVGDPGTYELLPNPLSLLADYPDPKRRRDKK